MAKRKARPGREAGSGSSPCRCRFRSGGARAIPARPRPALARSRSAPTTPRSRCSASCPSRTPRASLGATIARPARREPRLRRRGPRAGGARARRPAPAHGRGCQLPSRASGWARCSCSPRSRRFRRCSRRWASARCRARRRAGSGARSPRPERRLLSGPGALVLNALRAGGRERRAWPASHRGTRSTADRARRADGSCAASRRAGGTGALPATRIGARRGPGAVSGLRCGGPGLARAARAPRARRSAARARAGRRAARDGRAAAARSAASGAARRARRAARRTSSITRASAPDEPRQEASPSRERTASRALPAPDVGRSSSTRPRARARYDRDSLIMNSRILEKKLADFGVRRQRRDGAPRARRSRCTSSSRRPGVKVNRIVNLSDDLALALRALSVRIIAPLPGQVGGRHRGAERRSARSSTCAICSRARASASSASQAARSRSARTSSATPSTPTSRRCRTCSSRAPRARARACS